MKGARPLERRSVPASNSCERVTLPCAPAATGPSTATALVRNEEKHLQPRTPPPTTFARDWRSTGGLHWFVLRAPSRNTLRPFDDTPGALSSSPPLIDARALISASRQAPKSLCGALQATTSIAQQLGSLLCVV